MNIDGTDLQCFLNRHNFSAPNASVLFLDYQGGNKTDIDNLILKFKNLEVGPLRKITRIIKVSHETNKFYTLGGDLIVIDLHNNEDILSNLRSAFQYFHRFNSFSNTMTDELINPPDIGYGSIEILT